ncbi:prephenate dehydratase [Shewanella surugensis]|uniref:Prephenate dehydratase n=1 Tax=Shewanella surugensis TaxID=212020 RepID=A0ABT0L6G1_9GAMM|nr:prephenate dehydratase [Shewanella surugensis]MCL1123075.1 prephenate dehydratase [Shewanella surugensis]
MSKPQPLNHTREQITALDNDLLALLAKRRELSLDVARSKEVDVRPIRDTKREKELLARLVKQGREKGLDAHYVISLYQSIIEDSVLNQQAFLHGRANPDTQKPQYTAAYLGAKGSYSYLAATRYCARRQVDMQEFGCQSFDAIIQAVESGQADYGFLPIENTSSGSINEVYDVLQHTSLAIVGETTIEVEHCLLVQSGSNINHIKTVYAHPQPISQCSRYLGLHGQLKLEYCASSAEAMEKVKQSKTADVAAIGSAEGGSLYQLEAIEKGLANQKINQSRFIVVAQKSVDVPEQLPAKSTLIMATGQKPGALVDALSVLKAHNLNMSKLESRPIAGTPWEEMFYLDIEANLSSSSMTAALKELEKITRFIKVLGCYPSESVKPTHLDHQQLMLGSTSEQPERLATTENSQPLRYSKAYKTTHTLIKCGQLEFNAEQPGAIIQIQLPIEPNVFEQQVKTLKESGFQAVLLRGLHLQQDVENALVQFKKSLDHFNLACIIVIEYGSDLTLAAHYGDILFLDGAQMFNQSLLTQLGTLLLPVIVERNHMANTEALLTASNTVLSQGNQQVILCESGINMNTGINMNNSEHISLDLAGLVSLKNATHLPVITNPCYAVEMTQINTYIPAIKNLRADGLVLHLSQSTQAINPDEVSQLNDILRSLYH